MARWMLIILSCLVALLHGASLQSRIMNGNEVELASEFPWNLSIRIYDRQNESIRYLCGGSILSPTFVLTARHCVELGGKYEVRGASVNRLSFPVSITATKRHVHKLYDVALIELDEPFQFTGDLMPVNLPRRSLIGRDLTNSTATVTGFGIREDGNVANLLHSAEQRVISFEECKRIYGSNVNEENMCTEADGKNVCDGDSGSALVMTDDCGETVQIGVVSFGADRGCDAGYPSGYVQTTFILEWLETVAELKIRN